MLLQTMSFMLPSLGDHLFYSDAVYCRLATAGKVPEGTHRAGAGATAADDGIDRRPIGSEYSGPMTGNPTHW
jgi:hypothetical protein